MLSGVIKGKNLGMTIKKGESSSVHNKARQGPHENGMKRHPQEITVSFHDLMQS